MRLGQALRGAHRILHGAGSDFRRQGAQHSQVAGQGDTRQASSAFGLVGDALLPKARLE